jgi:hypothetical protein
MPRTARARRENLAVKTDFDDVAKRAMFLQNFN